MRKTIFPIWRRMSGHFLYTRVSAQVNDLCNPVGVMTTEILPTRVEEFIKRMTPWAHGHQIKAITKFVLAIIDKQTGNQAELARTQGNQEAAVKQLSRLIHNPRLKPKDFAKWLCLQVLANQVPRSGRVRLTNGISVSPKLVSEKLTLGHGYSPCSPSPCSY